MGYMSIGELGHIAEPRRRDWVARYPSSLRNRIERVQEVARRSGERSRRVTSRYRLRQVIGGRAPIRAGRSWPRSPSRGRATRPFRGRPQGVTRPHLTLEHGPRGSVMACGAR